jgi:hypothetical protein
MPSTLTGSAYLILAFSERMLNVPHVSFRQTVFYTPTTMTVSQGDNITGRLVCSPNTRNNRDLDITITYKAGNDADNTIHYKMCVFFLDSGASDSPWSGYLENER